MLHVDCLQLFMKSLKHVSVISLSEFLLRSLFDVGRDLVLDLDFLSELWLSFSCL